jgi:hypothetical protein
MTQQTPSPDQGGPDVSSALDLIWGVAGIGKAIGRTPRQTFHMLENGRLPAKKIGGRWCASRQGLHKFFGDLTDGKLAA